MDNVKKVDCIYDEKQKIWLNRFKVRSLDGTVATVELPRSECDPARLRKELLAQGAALPALAECREALAQIIEQVVPIARRPASTGWIEDDDGASCYSTTTFVASSAEHTRWLPPIASGLNVGLRTCGSLEAWQSAIQPAAWSSVMMVMLCAVFAAPFLALLNRPNFGLVFFGPSRTGKSMGQLVAASVLGFGREEDLPTLNATEAGLLAAGLLFNDHMLPINEVGTARGSKADVARAVRDAAYRLMSGQDTLRHPTWSGHGTGAKTSYKVLPLLTSEYSPEEWAERGGDIRDPGELVRLIGAPVLLNGAPSIFDRIPMKVGPEVREAWEKRSFAAMRDELPKHRGVAYQRFLEQLVCSVDDSVTAANDVVTRFEQSMHCTSMKPIERDIVSKFGVLLAGGFRANDFHILTMPKNNLREAVEKTCQAALAALPNRDTDLRNDLAKIRQLFTGSSIVDLRRCSRRELQQIACADGYLKAQGPKLTYTVRATTVLRLFNETVRVRRVLDWFNDEGLLSHRRMHTSGRAIAWAETQPSWPDGTRPRSIVFELPRGLDEFDRILHPGD